jgi:sodium pump decarboxylase gamma subunit
MISSGLLISIIGIGMVFLIFVILIIAIKVTSAVVAFFEKKFPEQSTVVLGQKAGIHDNTDDVLVAIAIATANHFEKGSSTDRKR